MRKWAFTLVILLSIILFISGCTLSDNQTQSISKTNTPGGITLEYGKEIAVEKGKLLQFPDFSIMLKDTETRTFMIGEVQRSNSVDHYEVKYKENGKEVIKQLNWSYGYPGELAEGLGIVTINGEKFSIYMNSNGNGITVQKT